MEVSICRVIPILYRNSGHGDRWVTFPYASIPVPSEPGYDYEGESYNAPFGTYSPQSELIEETDSETHSHTFTAKGTLSSTGTGNGQNLPPYITCYMWKRIA